VLQKGHLSNKALEQYLSHVKDDVLLQKINEEVEGVPPIFYVVDSNNADVLRTWAGKGGNINAVIRPSMIPLLVFAILLAQKTKVDTTDLIRTLVSTGADISVIPKSLLVPFPDEEINDHH